MYVEDSAGPYLFYESVEELRTKQRERTREAAAAPRVSPSSPTTASPSAASAAPTTAPSATDTAYLETLEAAEEPGALGEQGTPAGTAQSIPGDSEVHQQLRAPSSDADEEKYYP
jgi:hypothetical protein